MTRLLLIGAAGLDWPGFNARLDAGQAPNLAALRARGTAGWLRGWPPFDGPAPWVTLVTGTFPETHGVWRIDEPGPAGVRPVSRASWRVAPVWERLAEAGVSTGSVSWPAARPGAAWRGDHIDWDAFAPSGLSHDDWAMPLDCAPREVREALRDLRVHPAGITGEMLAPLVPGLGALDQSRDTALPRLALAMARAASVQSAAAWLLTERRPEAVFVHHEWLGAVSAGFEAPPDPTFARVMDGAWRFFDGLVGRLADLAGPECLVLVASPGWRGNPGVLVTAGRDVAGDLQGADARDVTPTVLAAFGLEDPALPGRPLPQVVPEEARRPAPTVNASPPPVADAALLQQALDAGYAAPSGPPAIWYARGLTDLALMLLPRDAAAAVTAADAAIARDPTFAPAHDAKAMAHVVLEQSAPLPDLAATLRRLAPGRGWGPLTEGAWHVLEGRPAEAFAHIREAEADGDVEFRLRIAAVWFAAGRPDEAGRVFGEILAVAPDHVSARVGLGAAAAARRDFRAAEEALVAAVRRDPGRAPAWRELADIYRRTGRLAEAARAARLAESAAPLPTLR